VRIDQVETGVPHRLKIVRDGYVPIEMQKVLRADASEMFVLTPVAARGGAVAGAGGAGTVRGSSKPNPKAGAGAAIEAARGSTPNSAAGAGAGAGASAGGGTSAGSSSGEGTPGATSTTTDAASTAGSQRKPESDDEEHKKSPYLDDHKRSPYLDER